MYIKVWLKAERSGSTSLVGSSSSKSASFAQPCVNRRTEVWGRERERQVWLLDTAAEKLVDSSSIKREKHKIAINCMLVHSFCALRQTVSANRLMRSVYSLFLVLWLVKVSAGSSLYTTAQSGFTTLALLPVEKEAEFVSHPDTNFIGLYKNYHCSAPAEKLQFKWAIDSFGGGSVCCAFVSVSDSTSSRRFRINIERCI